MPATPPPEDLVQAIAHDLYDDALRLVLADWFEEQGETAYAEFIRVQLELEPVRGRYEDARAVELHARESALLREHRQQWEIALPEGADEWKYGISTATRRGLVDSLSMPASSLLQWGGVLRARFPTLRRLVLFRVQGYGKRLAACPALEGLAELELACWYSDADARALAKSPHLKALQVLEIWLARRGRLSDAQLCKIMASAAAWPRLRELTLLDPDGDSRKGLLEVANRAAGRALAVHQRGYPERFPFAADFWYTYPGRLPDGRACMAVEDTTRTPPDLGVVTFDEDGHLTEEVLRVPLPDVMLAHDPMEWYKHKDAVQAQLRAVLGFEPAFLRVHEFQFPWDRHWNLSPSRGFPEDWDLLGQPDAGDYDEANWEDRPSGIGGKITWLIRGGQFCFGQEAWADNTGRVHST